jgi:predicted nucleic acid-binding protein
VVMKQLKRSHMVTFDEQFDRVPGIKRLEPA